MGNLPMPPFFSRPGWHTSPYDGHFTAFCCTGCGTRVRVGPGGTQGGHGHGNLCLESTGDLTQAKVFASPRGALMRASHWELSFLHWEEKGGVKLQRSGPK